MIEISVVIGLFIILMLAIRAKNKRINKLESDQSNLREGFNAMSSIIREANIMNVPPKDLED